MNLCGKYCLAQATQSIAVADLIFSLGCLLVHILEYTSSYECRREWNPQELTLVMSVLGIRPGGELVYMKNATTILCWIYFGIFSTNLILALVLWQAVLQESILKSVSYLLISWLLLASGLIVFIFHITVLGKCPHYFALAMYPVYWAYKIYALFVIKCFLSELRESPGQKRVRLRREYFQLEDMAHETSIKFKKDDRRSKITELVHLGTLSYQRYKSKIADWKKTVPTLSEFEEEQYDIEERLLKLDHKNLLEWDEFSATLQGSLTKTDGKLVTVAVKTLKVTTPSIPYTKRLLDEAKSLVRIGAHENLLSFIGICRMTMAKDKLLVVYESFGIGKLAKFLSDIREGLRTDFTFRCWVKNGTMLSCNGGSVNASEFNSFSMILWSNQIASAMEFLHAQKVVVGCISARNIILTDLHTAKICEYYLPQKFAQKTYSRDDLPGQFAWRWCSLECMESMEYVCFTTRSDVWSYAVLLWEIFTLGELPYADWNCDIVLGLRKHWRLRRTDQIPFEIYELMNTCWTEQPKERPSFKLVVLFLKQFISKYNFMHCN